MSCKSTESKEGSIPDINDLLKNLSLKDPADNFSNKLKNTHIKPEETIYSEENSEYNSPNDSGYEDDKESKNEKSEIKNELDKYKAIHEEAETSSKLEQIKEKESADSEESDEGENASDELTPAKEIEVQDGNVDSTVICHQDLIITGDREETEKDEHTEESEAINVALKNEKDIEASGYIRRTGKTQMSPNHGILRGQDSLYFKQPKASNLDNTNNYLDDRFYQYSTSSPQAFSSFLLNSNSNFGATQNSQCLYSDSVNTGLWYDSPQSSPSPYYQGESNKNEFKNISPDSEWDTASCSGNSYLTPPPSVSPPKQFLDGTSPCHQSCIQIVNLIDKVDQSTLAGSAPEDELKNLLSALECEQDSSLWNMGPFMSGNMNEQANVHPDMSFNQDIHQLSESNDQVSNMWKDIQETDSNELSVYLPHQLSVDEAERAVMNCCDPQTMFELESRVSAVLSNNPMAIIPDDQHGDTNLIVLASRDKDKRDKIVEKIYALAKGLANVLVCCNSPVDNFHCVVCGNTNPESFYTPLTLSNVQGYTALSCAVLRGYPAIIVKYLVALIHQNKMDLAREFCGDRNKLYLSARDYPYLSTYATEYAPTNW